MKVNRNTVSHVVDASLKQVASCANGLRFGFLFLRNRWFKIPHKVYAAGKPVSLLYPAEEGVQTDFVTCFVRNDYGLRRHLGDVRTILDIGANIGFFSIAARGRYPAATIHAYEPNPRVLPFLKSNTSTLDISVYDEAIGSHNGFVDMLDAGPSNQARTSATDVGSIPLIAFDLAIQRMGGQVDLLKLDCEGAEWDLFELTDSWKKIRDVRMEYHLFHNETVMQVESSLRSLGFRVIHLVSDVGFGMVWATRSSV